MTQLASHKFSSFAAFYDCRGRGQGRAALRSSLVLLRCNR
jgi:hypothetical protein